MYLNKGEVRKIGIEVISQLNQDFVIETADFIITKITGEVLEQGIPTIEGHKIITLLSATEIGKYCCEFTYRIGPEILKAKVYAEVR
jgi:hypothetical protein